MKTRRLRRTVIRGWDELPLLLSTEQVSQLLDVSYVTANSYISKNLIHAVKIGGKVFVPKTWLMNYFEEQGGIALEK